jgi:hypothetical protein
MPATLNRLRRSIANLDLRGMLEVERDRFHGFHFLWLVARLSLHYSFNLTLEIAAHRIEACLMRDRAPHRPTTDALLAEFRIERPLLRRSEEDQYRIKEEGDRGGNPVSRRLADPARSRRHRRRGLVDDPHLRGADLRVEEEESRRPRERGDHRRGQ